LGKVRGLFKGLVNVVIWAPFGNWWATLVPEMLNRAL